VNKLIFPVLTTSLVATSTALFLRPAPVEARYNSTGSFIADPVHSSINFKIRHAGSSNFYGRFNDFQGTFTLDHDSPENSVFNFTVELSSVDTKVNDRDNHLRSPDFFNTKLYSQATFASTFVERVEEGTYSVTGDFSLHGVTKEITAIVTHIADGTFQGSQRTGIEAKFELKRSDFGITSFLAADGGESGGLGNKVTILASFEGIKQ
jgi:polyisoprenoid-binding protein YceI